MPREMQEAGVTIIGNKISASVLISLVVGILFIGGLIITIKNNSERIDKVEDKIELHFKDHDKVLESLIRIEENSKFLRQVIDDIRKGN